MMRMTVVAGLLLATDLGIGAAACGAVPETAPSAPAPSSSPSTATAASTSPMEATMQLTSPAFEDEGDIPARYTCDGEGISPALAIEDLPPETVSLVLIVDDPDAPGGTWDHWVAYDIEPRTEIPEAVESLGTPGNNSWGHTGYGRPCPPSGAHRYVFTVYALDATLDWDPGADKDSVVGAIHDHVIAEATLLGFYARA